MRFVAGSGAVAELLQAGNRRHRGLPAGTLQRRAIGKMLLARAPQWQRYWLAGAPWGAAGRGAVAELLAGSAMAKRIAALWQRAIWKMLLTGALWQRYCCQGEPSGRRC